MSNGDPPPVSGSPYIIICSGRTEVLATKDPAQKIAAANRCAANLASFLGVAHQDDPDLPANLSSVSVLQHELMDGMDTMSKAEVDAKIAELFTELDELEDKYE